MKSEKVVIHMEDFILVGCVHLRRVNIKVADYLNSSEQFIPMSNVTILDKDGRITREEEFVCVNKNAIRLIKHEGE